LELALMGRAAEKSSASSPSAPSSAKFDAALPLRFFEVELAGLKKEKMFSFAVRAGRVYKNPMGRMGSCKVQVDEDWGVERPLAICGSLEAAAGPESLRDMAAQQMANIDTFLLLLQGFLRSAEKHATCFEFKAWRFH
jgi:hypothetical protein